MVVLPAPFSPTTHILDSMVAERSTPENITLVQGCSGGGGGGEVEEEGVEEEEVEPPALRRVLEGDFAEHQDRARHLLHLEEEEDCVDEENEEDEEAADLGELEGDG